MWINRIHQNPPLISLCLCGYFAFLVLISHSCSPYNALQNSDLRDECIHCLVIVMTCACANVTSQRPTLPRAGSCSEETDTMFTYAMWAQIGVSSFYTCFLLSDRSVDVQNKMGCLNWRQIYAGLPWPSWVPSGLFVRPRVLFGLDILGNKSQSQSLRIPHVDKSRCYTIIYKLL